MRTIPCPLCHEVTFQLLEEKTYARLTVATVLCPSCGLVYHNPVVEDSDRQALGLSHGELHTDTAIKPRHLRRVTRRLAYQTAFLKDIIQPGWRTLEIGCGLGHLSNWLRDQGCHTLGLEPDGQQAEFAREQLGLEVRQCRFEAAQLDTQFDFFAASHVIEHFPEPIHFLRSLRALAAPQARLFVETPNILAPKVGPTRLFSLAHNFYFSPETLAAGLAQTGWRVLKYRVFHRDSFMMLAQADRPQEAVPPRQHAQEVRRAIAYHRVGYYLHLQFLWRKIPLWRRLWMYRYRDYPGRPTPLNLSVSGE